MSTSGESVTPALNLEKCSVVLLDVAGTTTSLNFVKETLFPYVTKQAEDFLKKQWEDEDVKSAVKALKDAELDVAGATAAVKELTEQNSENIGLKTIQGLIYKKGYEGGDLKAHVFSDVPASLEAWAKSRKVAIYSTGSIESQKLLFTHTTEGDVSSHIAKYFDQTIGNKTESGSYEKIAKELEVKPEEIVFVTDSDKEAEAAKTAGVISVLVKREGNQDISEEAIKTIPIINSFKEIVFENPSKRKNEGESVSSEEQPPSKVAKTEDAEDKSSKTETPVQEAPQEAEKMDVDAPVEKEVKDTKEKVETSTEKLDSEKTEAKSNDNKTEENRKETEKAEQTPMETGTSGAEEDKKIEGVATVKPEETEEKKEETATVTEEPKEEKSKTEETKETVIETEKKEDKTEQDDKNNEKEDKTEQMETDGDSNKDSNKGIPVTESKEKTVEAVIEEKKAECKEIEKEDNKSANVESKEVETKESVHEKTEDPATKEETKAVEEKTEEVKVDDTKTEEITTKKEIVAKEDKRVVEENTKVEIETNGTEAKDNGVEQLEKKGEEKEESKPEEEKSVTDESCPKEDKTEASTSETTTETNKEGKENKSELANRVENGNAAEAEALNGDAQEKQNGDAKAEESDNIKVKKIEESSENTPAVSVEV